MFIIHIPELNNREYIEFYNLSGTCELKTKLRIKSYDKILRYLRKQNIQDADNITALVDYKTGAQISESPDIAQYTQFTIIRHPLRKLIMDWEMYGKGGPIFPPYRNEDIILCDDRDFMIKFLTGEAQEHEQHVFNLKISNRLNSDIKVVKTLLEMDQWNDAHVYVDTNKMATKMFNKIDHKIISNKEFILELMYFGNIYQYLSYDLKIDIDIIYCIWDTEYEYNTETDYDKIYNFLINKIHPDGLTSDLLRKCNIKDEYLIKLYKHILPTKLDKDIWTKIIYQYAKSSKKIDIKYIARSISISKCMTCEEFMQILGTYISLCISTLGGITHDEYKRIWSFTETYQNVFFPDP
jgi:hypothetical protein